MLHLQAKKLLRVECGTTPACTVSMHSADGGALDRPSQELVAVELRPGAAPPASELSGRRRCTHAVHDAVSSRFCREAERLTEVTSEICSARA